METPAENKEKALSFGIPHHTETAEQFPGSTIVIFEKNGEMVRYALRRDPSGNLEGSEFTLQERRQIPGSTETYWTNSASRTEAAEEGNDNLRIGPAHQMHEDQLREMDEALKNFGISV